MPETVRPENRALGAVVLAICVVSSVVSSYLLLTQATSPDSLPVASGTLFTARDASTWDAQFTVGSTGGSLVGAWTAYNGSGFLSLSIVNGSVSKPPNAYLCPRIILRWAERNGTVNLALAGGSYTAFWTTGYCSSAQRIVVTQTIQVLPA